MVGLPAGSRTLRGVELICRVARRAACGEPEARTRDREQGAEVEARPRARQGGRGALGGAARAAGGRRRGRAAADQAWSQTGSRRPLRAPRAPTGPAAGSLAPAMLGGPSPTAPGASKARGARRGAWPGPEPQPVSSPEVPKPLRQTPASSGGRSRGPSARGRAPPAAGSTHPGGRGGHAGQHLSRLATRVCGARAGQRLSSLTARNEVFSAGRQSRAPPRSSESPQRLRPLPAIARAGTRAAAPPPRPRAAMAAPATAL